uniref:Condensin complex subunit 1 C-terminal domain-containing protein n=1 Tax=Dendroctonus ponderosae TaxID=77166 RepID=A0AAR5P0Z3_DENPD
MNFVETFRQYHSKLVDPSIVTKIWKEIIIGRRSLISVDSVIEYSFHYPVDTEFYLEELLDKFESAMKEDLRTIEGNLKAYIQTFIYYCLGSADRIPIRTSLLSAELYLKILLLPSDIGKLYFEKNMFVMVLYLCTKCIRKQNIPTEQLTKVLELIYKYVSERSVSFLMIQGTANLYANVLKHRSIEGDIKKCDDPLAMVCLNCLKNLIVAKEHPREVKYIMESMLRCMRTDISKTISPGQRKIAICLSKKFIKNVMFVEIEDKNKMQYFLDALFALIGVSDFEYFEDCCDIINMLDEQLYKEFLRRLPNYLESKNHEKYYVNIMCLLYYMLSQPHPGNFPKLNVLYSVCIKEMVIKLLHRKKSIQYRSIEILAKICLLRKNAVLDGVFEIINITGNLATIRVSSILRAFVRILDDQYAGNPVRSKQILHIVSKFLISIDKVDADLSSQILFLVCKDGTPYSVKNVLPELHSLYLQLSEKLSCGARLAIMRIFFKMAMHADPSSSVFIEHLYNSMIYSSTIHGVVYGPEQYSNLLMSEEFDYELFLPKCRHLIKYDQVCHLISNFKCKEPGYCILLNSLLDYVKYKEYNILTDYIIDNFEDICCVDAAGHLLNGYRRIILNKGVYNVSGTPKFNIIHGLLWNSLFKQICGVTSIKASFDLIDTLNEILHLPNDEEQRVTLLTLISECAYRDLKQNDLMAGSVMTLTEVCIALKRPPRNEILVIFGNVMDDPRTMSLLKTKLKDALIQLISFFGTMAMMDRPKIPTASKMFRKALEVPDPLVQLTAIKMYYTLSSELSHEFEDIIKFCFKNVTSDHTVLSRVCLTILEELIYDSYVLLDSESFMRFIHRLASYSLSDFMRHMLNERFLVSNKHDVGRFYMTTLVYMSGHTKLEDYPINESFRKDLVEMRNLLDIPNDLIKFLFTSIQPKTRFSILNEICLIFDLLVAGKCKIDDNFFIFFNYSLYTFKVMTGKTDFKYRNTFYGQVCRSVNKQIFNRDGKCKDLALYGEYESDVRRCTISLLQLLYFIQNEDRLNEYLCPVFDALACWIDHVKPELIHYIQYENGKEFDHPLKRLVHFYKSNKLRLENYINNQESGPSVIVSG